MRYTDFLRTTVLLSIGSATALCIVTVGTARGQDGSTLIIFALVWWTVAAIAGLVMGRAEQPLETIAQAISRSRAEPIFPRLEPTAIMVGRQWPLIAFAVAAGALSAVVPSAAPAGAGAAILGAVAMRKQPAAVAAIEERDGVRFYVVRTPPFSPIKLVRVRGYGALTP